MRAIAVIDIGKTNAKLALVNVEDLREIEVVTRPNRVISSGQYPHYDTEGHWQFILSKLREFAKTHDIAAISITTHGASAALLNEAGELTSPILDYEYTGPDGLAAAYDAIRPSFAETGSPRLPMGLNLGAQFYWQIQNIPQILENTAHIVTYPQYWGAKLTGEFASDWSSLGCHTDLWNPYERSYSSLVETLGIGSKMAVPKAANAVLGNLRETLCETLGLSNPIPVYCGIHDSNASLYPYLNMSDTPFSVVSTGTWVVVMTIGGKEIQLDAKKDTLVNVDAFGAPVPSARFMGGREHDIILSGQSLPASAEDCEYILQNQIMLMPAVEANTGPFQGQNMHWLGEEPAIGTGARNAALGYYLALVTHHCLKLSGHQGKVIIEGPFAKNAAYLDMLCALEGEVYVSESQTGTTQGAALLALDANVSAPVLNPWASKENVKSLSEYAKSWQAHLPR